MLVPFCHSVLSETVLRLRYPRLLKKVKRVSTGWYVSAVETLFVRESRHTGLLEFFYWNRGGVREETVALLTQMTRSSVAPVKRRTPKKVFTTQTVRNFNDGGYTSVIANAQAVELAEIGGIVEVTAFGGTGSGRVPARLLAKALNEAYEKFMASN